MKEASPTTWAILPRASPAAHLKIGLGLSRAPITRVRADLRTSSGPNVLLFSAKPYMKRTFQSRGEREDIKVIWLYSRSSAKKYALLTYDFLSLVTYPKIYWLKILKTQKQSYVCQLSTYGTYRKTCRTSLFYQTHCSTRRTLMLLNLI